MQTPVSLLKQAPRHGDIQLGLLLALIERLRALKVGDPREQGRDAAGFHTTLKTAYVRT